MITIHKLDYSLHNLLSKRGYDKVKSKIHSYHLSDEEFLTNYYKNVDNGHEISVCWELIHKRNAQHSWEIEYKLFKINDKLILRIEDADEELKKCPKYRKYPFAAHSTNFRYIKAIGNRMKRLGVTIHSPDVMDKLATIKSYKEYINKLRLEYPNETPLGYLAMFCKVTCMRGQSRDVLRVRRYIPGQGFKCDLRPSLEEYFKEENLTWKNCWKHLRALAMIKGDEPRIRKEDVKLSDKAMSIEADYDCKQDWQEHPKSLREMWNLDEKKYKGRGFIEKPKPESKPEVKPEDKLPNPDEIKSGMKRLSCLLNVGIGNTTVVLEGLAHNIGVMKGVDHMRIVIYRKRESDALNVILKLKQLGFSEDEYVITDDISTSNYKDVVWFL